MGQATKLPPKEDVARALLLRGPLFVHLDPGAPGVEVPRRFVDQPQLVLQVGLDLPVPIADLRVDTEGVTGTLSFARMPHLCHVPWSAVFALVGDDGRGMVWPEDMPEEIAAEVEREAGIRAPVLPQPGTVIRGDAKGTRKPRRAKPAAKQSRPPYLRLVK